VSDGDGRRDKERNQLWCRSNGDVGTGHREERIQQNGAAVKMIKSGIVGVRVRGRVFGKRRSAVAMDQRFMPTIDVRLMHVLGRSQRQHPDEYAERQGYRTRTGHCQNRMRNLGQPQLKTS
jgi:hypothetical protein